MASSKGFYSDLPTWAKGVIAVGVLGSLVLIGIAIRNAIKKGQENKGDRQANQENDKVTQDALNALQKQGISPSLTDNDATALSRYIEVGLSGAETVATEDGIMNQIKDKVKNQADWVKLQQNFGVRTIPDIFWGSTTYDLRSLLLDQLDSHSYLGLGARYSDILVEDLKKQGVTF